MEHVRLSAVLYPSPDNVRPCYPPACPAHTLSTNRIPNFIVKSQTCDGTIKTIPFQKHWWLPIHWFIRQLQWTEHPSNRAQGSNPLHYQSTFAELATACELATHGGIADNSFDLRQKIDIFRAAFERYYRRSQVLQGSTEMSYKKFFDPHPYVRVCTPLGLSSGRSGGEFGLRAGRQYWCAQAVN